MSRCCVLYLMCHGEAENSSATGDFKRHLTLKGRKQIQSRLNEFKYTLVRPDCILSSTALRAKETAAMMSELFQGTPCFYRDSLYLAPAFRIIDLLKEMDSVFQRIMVVAHKKGLEQVISLLSEKGKPVLLRQGECVALCLNITNWQDIKTGIGKIIHL